MRTILPPEVEPQNVEASRSAKPLTDPAIRLYKPGKKLREIKDGGMQGLYLCIHPKSGTKVFIMKLTRPDGRSGHLTLGRYLSGAEFDGEPEIGMPLSLAAARLLAAKVHKDRKLGKDPIAENKAKKRRQRLQISDAAANTFSTMARAYINEHAKAKTRRWQETATILGWDYSDPVEPIMTQAGLSERWADKPVASIDEDEVFEIIDEAGARGIPGIKARTKGHSDARARAMHSTLSGMFTWLRKKKRKIKTNPCTGIELEAKPNKRDRVLTADEIKWFWAACADADKPRIEGAPRHFNPVLKLLILTGQRLNEVAGMRRSELQGDDWHLPKERTKNGRSHIVPLSRQARALIPDGDNVIFSNTGGATPLSGWSTVKLRLDAKMAKLAEAEGKTIPPWRLHDLRRSAATHMGELGIQPHVIEAVLNHVSGSKAGVAGLYNRSQLLPERKAALQRWADHLQGLVSGTPDNVIPIRRGATT